MINLEPSASQSKGKERVRQVEGADETERMQEGKDEERAENGEVLEGISQRICGRDPGLLFVDPNGIWYENERLAHADEARPWEWGQHDPDDRSRHDAGHPDLQMQRLENAGLPKDVLETLGLIGTEVPSTPSHWSDMSE